MKNDLSALRDELTSTKINHAKRLYDLENTKEQ
jgi:hypothetical protein